MDSFEINKVIAAVLLIALIVIGIGKISDIAFKVDKPEKSAYKVEIVEDSPTSSSKVEKAVEKIDIVALLALGNIEHGEKVFKKCAACHLINKGGDNKIGPALYGVLGRKVASKKDYKYSKAMAGYDKNWTFEEMNGYLKKPQSYIKGTKMAFAGLRKEKDRASVILYLNKNSDNPLPLP
ncbi:cytochrome c family protein [Candidatus Pelagibacter sp.]|nr:cytochrome c family protein [Candidatus Pelagibacter sp.]